MESKLNLNGDSSREKPFTFDFAITEQSKDWQELDAQIPVHKEERQKVPSRSFFSNSTAGNTYFNVSDPASVKSKWLEDRRLVKDAVRKTGKHFLWKANQSHKT